MRYKAFRQSARWGTVAVCLLSLPGLMLPLPGVQAQAGVNVEVTAEPTLFSSGAVSNVVICFSSIDTTAQQLTNGQTFTFLFPSSIGTLASVSNIEVSAVTLTPGNFTATFTLTPTPRVVVTYHQTGPTLFLNYGDAVCVSVDFTAATTTGTATGNVSLVSSLNKLANGADPYVTLGVVTFALGSGAGG